MPTTDKDLTQLTRAIRDLSKNMHTFSQVVKNTNQNLDELIRERRKELETRMEEEPREGGH